MHFMKTPDAANGEVDLAEEIRKALFADQKVLWLLTGGSSIPASVVVMQRLREAPLHNLTMMFGDERYGQVGHPDSNAQQLLDNGFNEEAASFIPTLENKSISETVFDFSKAFKKASSEADYIIGMFGLGTDGHIAGILPGSPAVDSQDLVVSYQGGGFTRITLTPKALSQVNIAYVFAFGETKLEPLTNLRDKDLSLEEMPAQLLKQLPDVYVYNDQIGDKV